MNKISAIMFGACALLTFSACSNDDPAIDNGGNGNGVSTKDRVYLAIKINTPGAQDSRAAQDSYGYEYGSATENKVTSANFYFYDEKGQYTGIKTQNWANGTATPNPGNHVGNEGNNVEYTSSGTIVLEGLEGKTYPKYMVTVLNQENAADFKVPSTLAGWADRTDWNSKNGGQFIMTTSSYFDGARDAAGNASTKIPAGTCYATELQESNFLQYTPTQVPFEESQRVQVYVERLAARVKVDVAMEKQSNGLYKTDMTVGGETNPSAKTELYVRFDGWSLYATAPKSRPSKSLEGYTEDTKFETAGVADDAKINWNWNDKAYKRSYWGKSAVWGLSESVLNIKDLEGKDMNYQSLKTGIKEAMYCNECTNEFSKVLGPTGNFADPNKTTSVLVAATVCDKDGKGLDLVEYRGVKYLKVDFIKYILSVVDQEYYTVTKKQEYLVYTDATQSETKTVVLNDYNQIGVNDVEIVSANDGYTGSIILKVKDGVKLFTLGDKTDDQEYTLADNSGNKVHIVTYATTTVDVATVDAELKNRVEFGGANAYAFTGGAMVYPIVIEHLNYKLSTNKEDGTEGKKIAEKAITRDGMVGVVRNHSYLINITKINNLGMGIYNPGSATESGEIIKPQPSQDPTYYVESTINILSWKLVEQDAEI